LPDTRLLVCAAFLLWLGSGAGIRTQAQTFVQPAEEIRCVVLTGLSGTPEYAETFGKWADATEKICRESIRGTPIRLDGAVLGKDEILSQLARAEDGAAALWLFVIGHGTYDGRTYRFNIKGPDLTTDDFKSALTAGTAVPTVLVAATSSSGELASALAGEGRIVLAATRSGKEQNPPLFMSFFLEAAASAEADRNKDRRLSLREVFDFCEEHVAEWYREEGRLQSEHPVLRESEGGPIRAALTYLSSPPDASYRSLEAKNLAFERGKIEREIEALKLRKAELSEDLYYQQLEQLLLRLAKLSQDLKRLEGGS